MRRPVPEVERPALVRRVLHDRLRDPLHHRADHRRGAVGAQPDRVDPLDAPLPGDQLRRARRLHPLPDGAAVDGVGGGLARRRLARLTSRGWRDLGLDRIDLILHGVGNPVAAMPSLHAGITFLVAGYAIQRLRSPWRWLLALYPLLMCTRSSTTASTTSSTSSPGRCSRGSVLVGCQAWENSRDRARFGAYSSVCFAQRLMPASTASSSIARSSSSVNGGKVSASRLVSSCSTELAHRSPPR